ncbi:unnamed protein product, partial [Polarella glacialis]
MNEAGSVQDTGPPAGFVPYGEEGWWNNPQTGVYLEPIGKRQMWLDAEAKEFRDLFEGSLAEGLTVAGGAATSLRGAGGLAAPKHLFIPDLHKTALALKKDLSHLDGPAAMLAVFESGAGAVHERLIRSLAAFRSEWSEEALCVAAAEALTQPCEAAEVAAAAVVLVVGHRAVAATVAGARCWLVSSAAGEEATTATRGTARALCHHLPSSASSSADSLCLAVSVGELSLEDAEVAEIVRADRAQPAPRCCAPLEARPPQLLGRLALLAF